MNVYEAAMLRMEVIFTEFDNIYVSFSGGKDSGVMLNLAIDYMRKKNITKKIGVFHMDYEAQYELTTQYVDEVLNANQDLIDVYRICIPFKVETCTSMHQRYWRPWDKKAKEIWVRALPDNAITVMPFFNDKMWDYEFQIEFGNWLHKEKQAAKTCCLVGIRTQESLNRWRAIHSDKNHNKYNGYEWTTNTGSVVNAYPIYDWNTSDIWVANAKFGYSYNKLYDLYYQAGVPIEKMRVASPFLSTAQESLQLYRTIEPHTWGKLVSRVNGVNFTGIYGGTTAMGWNSIKLPYGHTWESYMYFLLSTLPEETRANYMDKLSVSMKFWKEKGGVMAPETIEKLKAAGVSFQVGESTNYKTSKLPVKMDYIDEIDISEAKEIPTFKRMCICIMKNDHLCKYMGFSFTKNELARRKNIMDKYKSML